MLLLAPLEPLPIADCYSVAAIRCTARATYPSLASAAHFVSSSARPPSQDLPHTSSAWKVFLSRGLPFTAQFQCLLPPSDPRPALLSNRGHDVADWVCLNCQQCCTTAQREAMLQAEAAADSVDPFSLPVTATAADGVLRARHYALYRFDPSEATPPKPRGVCRPMRVARNPRIVTADADGPQVSWP